VDANRAVEMTTITMTKDVTITTSYQCTSPIHASEAAIALASLATQSHQSSEADITWAILHLLSNLHTTEVT
jgi:hypothetical protein